MFESDFKFSSITEYYEDLSPFEKQQYIFHKVTSKLVEYGYYSIRISGDFYCAALENKDSVGFEGADILATGFSGLYITRMQPNMYIRLKEKFTISKSLYQKNFFIAYLAGSEVLLYEHDKVFDMIPSEIAESLIWKNHGKYESTLPPSIFETAIHRLR